ncbi:D-amino acid deaminase [Beutenbergia cavernae DSM 12333]|uniref:D-amino acid deaminase n=1 Tax=Beutenbergia cavernae (strain ATCC BAA-8 / DSM 12333 / CCUG 43141 / JCM 11478 / NBRC 16432 / NCIMB 13614 / HKI 0122) TaxID=471853 RepID=C5BZP8_BEUC1|nr:alanine racemase [Beutenbergia cavernae]ACQ81228.1 D-amino acid deaminase [Beutenbergia cavernae DSM 12333]
MDLSDLSRLPPDPLGKVLGPGFDGVARADLSATTPPVAALTTPFLSLDRTAVTDNIAALQGWCDERGYLLAPHGKTTMAPQLWSRQLRAGAWGMSVATQAQLQVALTFGVRRILLANPLTTRAGVERARAALVRDPQLEILSWVDSEAVVDVLGSRTGPDLPVLLDIGRRGGRTGVRDVDAARAVVDRVHATPGTRLAGSAAYEGAIGGDPSRSAIAAFATHVLQMHREVVLPRVGPGAYLSIGGSDHLAEVDDGLADLSPADGRVVVRSGVSIAHDDWHYSHAQEEAPPNAPRFRSALRLVATVLAVHDDGVALLDAGRRDAGHDHGLPVVLELWRAGQVVDVVDGPLPTASMNDQHTFVEAGVFGTPPVVGDNVVLGISHPCTTFDKWRDIVEVDGRLTPRSVAVGLVRTYF